MFTIRNKFFPSKIKKSKSGIGEGLGLKVDTMKFVGNFVLPGGGGGSPSVVNLVGPFSGCYEYQKNIPGLIFSETIFYYFNNPDKLTFSEVIEYERS